MYVHWANMDSLIGRMDVRVSWKCYNLGVPPGKVYSDRQDNWTVPMGGNMHTAQARENSLKVVCWSGEPHTLLHRPPPPPSTDCLVSRRPVTSGPPRGEEQKREACTERELTPRKAGQEKGPWFDKKDCRGAENGVDGRKDLGRWTSLESWKKSEFSIMEA